MMKPWLMTRSGVKFDLIDPKPEMVRLDDIAWSLAHQCRFNGHCSSFYSIAEHCVHCSEVVMDPHKPWALMHDAAEAYIGDITRPVKQVLTRISPLVRVVELSILEAVATRFGLVSDEHYGLPPHIPREIERVDNAVLAAEAALLMVGGGASWGLPEPPANIALRYYSPLEAYRCFLDAAARLGIE